MKTSEELYLNGKTLFLFPFKIHFLPRGTKERKLIISVPKKNFKRAVKRNLVRRRIKEAIRVNVQYFPGMEEYNILIIYVAKEILDYGKIEESLMEGLPKISM